MTLPDDFTFVTRADPSILVELRYAGWHNFMGRPVPGYLGNVGICTRAAATALRAAQARARRAGYALKVYDAYRPQEAVDAFLRWAADPTDAAMRAEFYPRIAKDALFPQGYLAARSGHSRGSTVDVTLVPLPVPAQGRDRIGDALVDGTAPKGVRFDDNSIEMGTGFDSFDPLAHTHAPGISREARRNRGRLHDVMQRSGWEPHDREWWHFTLANEPFSATYLDFAVPATTQP